LEPPFCVRVSRTLAGARFLKPCGWRCRGTIAAVVKARLHLTFPERLLSVPVVHRLGTDFGLVTNIRRANLEESGGWIILEVEGGEGRIADAIVWLADQGLQVDRIED